MSSTPDVPAGLPVVFAGPSLAELPATLRGRIELRRPMRRGDADELLQRPAGVLVLIDGVFSSSLAVTPSECRLLLQAGWVCIGASSMGALRASECWPQGMLGVGEVFSLYRVGVLQSDADVAVALDPDNDRELTISIVHIRSMLAALVHAGELDTAAAARLLQRARQIHFLERTLESCARAWRSQETPALPARRLCQALESPGSHPKRRDAQLALRIALAELWLGARWAVPCQA